MWSAQGIVVALLVACCCVYAVWTLMPSAARRALAAALVRLPLPERLATKMRKTAQAAASGCGCDGCDRSESSKRPAAAAQTITFHPRTKR